MPRIPPTPLRAIEIQEITEKHVHIKSFKRVIDVIEERRTLTKGKLLATEKEMLLQLGNENLLNLLGSIAKKAMDFFTKKSSFCP